MAMAGLLRDRIAAGVGVPAAEGLHPDVPPEAAKVTAAAAGAVDIERARAELAEDVNRNPRLVVERALLRLPAYATG